MSWIGEFDRLWPCFSADVGLDEALETAAETLIAPQVEEVEGLLMHALEKPCSEAGVSGIALAMLMLGKFMAVPETVAAVKEAVTRMRDTEVLEALELDISPNVGKLLKELMVSLKLERDAPPRLRVLAIRNGFNLSTLAAKALRQSCDLRAPGSPHIAETGNEDAGGQGEQEMVAILNQHLQTHTVDLVVAQSRGCRLLVQHIIGGDTPCWSGPVLALSPAGEWGPTLAASAHAAGVLIAANGDDLVEFGGAHPVITRDDVEIMKAAEAAWPSRRTFVYQEERRGGWADIAPALAIRASAVKRVWCIRHGQAEHNVSSDYSLKDPALTELGIRQAKALTSNAALQRAFSEIPLQRASCKVPLLVSSPLHRTLQTSSELRKTRGDCWSPWPIVAHADLQECGNFPCDTGCPRMELEKTFGPSVDFSQLAGREDNWFDWATARRDVKGRCHQFTEWLLSRPEQDIIIVAHHGVFQQLIRLNLENCEVAEMTLRPGNDWQGCWELHETAKTIL